MNKKDYLKPTMKVVQLQQQVHLLQASTRDSKVGVNDYNWNDEDEE